MIQIDHSGPKYRLTTTINTMAYCGFITKDIFFFHPDYTVGTGIKPVQSLKRSRGLYRRSGISPCPEENCFRLTLQIYNNL